MIDKFDEISKKIHELNNENLKKYIVERLLYLEENTKIEKLGFNDNEIVSIYNGYISSKSPIKYSKSAEAFYLDKINIYYDFINKYKKHINELDILKMLQDLQDYFTNSFGLIGSQKIRDVVTHEYAKKIKNDTLSISDLTKTGAAMCLERSAILQNILSILGLNCYLIYGKLIRIKENEETEELHSYNLIHIKDDDYLIYDISNPLSIEINNEKKYFPAINVINSLELKSIINGEEYNFNNNQVERLFNFSATVLNEIKRIYTIG